MEHQATQTVAASIHELIDRQPTENDGSRPLALGAAPEGDFYVLPSLLGQLLLGEMGWRVRNLGINLPLASLANATLSYRPMMICLSISYLKDEETFVREYRSFYKIAAQTEAAVIVGGQALSAELRSRLVYASFGDRMAHLEEFARRLTNLATSSPAELRQAERDEQQPPG